MHKGGNLCAKFVGNIVFGCKKGWGEDFFDRLFVAIEGVGCKDVTYLDTYLDIRGSYKAW